MGADPRRLVTRPDGSGARASDIAFERGHTEVAAYLWEQETAKDEAEAAAGRGTGQEEPTEVGDGGEQEAVGRQEEPTEVGSGAAQAEEAVDPQAEQEAAARRARNQRRRQKQKKAKARRRQQEQEQQAEAAEGSEAEGSEQGMEETVAAAMAGLGVADEGDEEEEAAAVATEELDQKLPAPPMDTPAATESDASGGNEAVAATTASAPAPAAPGPARPPPLPEFLEAHAPDDLVCPITLALFNDPVMLFGDGFTYSRAPIEHYLALRRKRAWSFACVGWGWEEMPIHSHKS